MKRIILLLAIIVTGMTQELRAQKAAIKTKLPSDAFLNINLGAEVGLAPQWTLDASGQFNGWTLSHDRRRKHWVLQPEARYWLCDRFSGHFFGAHMHAGQYNVGGFNGVINLLGTDARKLKDYRYQGWFVGPGGATVPVHRMRQKSGNEQAAPLRGTDQGGHQSGLRLLNEWI